MIPQDIQTTVAGREVEAAKAAPTEASTHAALLTLARDRFNTVVEYESILRQEQLLDKRFRAGDQWDERDRASRRADKRPCLTVNRIPQFVRQITGAARQNRPAVTISPVDDDADPETAEVFQDIIRHIEAHSHADVAYDTAVDDQVVMGRGYFRIVTEADEDDPFDIDIRIKRIRNAHQVYYDPRCAEPDYADGLYAFVITEYSIEEFKRRYPKANHDYLTDDAFEGAIGDKKHLWFLANGTVRVAEYFYVEFVEEAWVQLSDGQKLAKADAEVLIAKNLAELEQMVVAAEQQMQQAAAVGLTPPPIDIPDPLTILREATRKKRVVKQCVINGVQVLSEGEWAGKWIPIIPVLGDELDIDGRVDLRGIVRDARDQQRLYNFQVSALVETIGLTPRAPYIIAAGQIEGFEKQWKTANTKSWAYLPYKAISVNGTFAPPPQRQSFEPAIAAIVAAIQQADNDLKATTGMYDASLGERGPEQSGKAILARQKQGETGNIHYIDNLARAQWALGRQLLDLIPKTWDIARVLRLKGLDDQRKTVMVHAGREDTLPDALPPGVRKVYDLSVGKYDVVVTTGPSHSTRRQEAVEMMTAAVQANPELMQIIGDLYFGAMDWPKARQIAERLKKMLPPNLQDEGEDGKPTPEQLEAKLGQLQQQLMEKTLLLQEASEEIRTDKVKALHQKEVALLNAKVELLKLKMTIAAGEDKQAAQNEHDASKQDRQHRFDAAKTKHTLQAQRQDKAVERRQHQADTLLDAEIGQLDTERSMAEAERVRTEQRDEQREARAFEAEQADAARQHEMQAMEAAAAQQQGAEA